MTQWERNAYSVENTFGGFVDWKERFYECPECGEPIYEEDWEGCELVENICPVCGYDEDDEEF